MILIFLLMNQEENKNFKLHIYTQLFKNKILIKKYYNDMKLFSNLTEDELKLICNIFPRDLLKKILNHQNRTMFCLVF